MQLKEWMPMLQLSANSHLGLLILFDMFYNAHNVMFIVDYPVFSF